MQHQPPVPVQPIPIRQQQAYSIATRNEPIQVPQTIRRTSTPIKIETAVLTTAPHQTLPLTVVSATLVKSIEKKLVAIFKSSTRGNLDIFNEIEVNILIFCLKKL